MPTPLGHALGGLAAGWLVAGGPGWQPRAGRGPAALASGSGADAALASPTPSSASDVGPNPSPGAWAVVRSVFASPGRWRTTWVFALLAIAPDLDLLVGAHSRHTHSIGAVLIVGLAAAWLGPTPRVRFGLAAAAAWGSHLLLDWMGNDTTPPIGIMALWPLTHDFYQSNLHVFLAVSRRWWLDEFWLHNIGAVAREVLILGPIALVIAMLRQTSVGIRRSPSQERPSRR